MGAAIPVTTADVPVAAGEPLVPEAVELGVGIAFPGIKTLYYTNMSIIYNLQCGFKGSHGGRWEGIIATCLPVNNMHNTVVSEDIGLDDLRVVHKNPILLNPKGDITSLNGLGSSAVDNDIAVGNHPRNNMVAEHCGQLLYRQARCSAADGLKGFVVGCEQSQLRSVCQCLNQVRLSDGTGESSEVGGGKSVR